MTVSSQLFNTVINKVENTRIILTDKTTTIQYEKRNQSKKKLLNF